MLEAASGTSFGETEEYDAFTQGTPVDGGSMSEAQRRPRRWLVVTYHLTPDGSVGGLRWAGMSKYLARIGWEVHIVTAAVQREPSPPGVTIHYVPRARTLNDRYNDMASRVRARRSAASEAAPANPASKGAAAPSAPRTSSRPGLFQIARQSVAYSLVFPDFARGWIFRAARVARGILTAQQFDVVVSSGPPHSAHIAAATALMGRSEPLWVDMRDPWVSYLAAQLISSKASPLRMAGPLLQLERFVMRRAQRVITNTAQFRELFQTFYPRMPVSFVSNGVDRDRLPAPAEKFPGFSVAYAGTVYYNRNLSPVLRALPQLLERFPEARGEVKLRVAGSMLGEHATRFWTEVDNLGLRDLVEMRGLVSNAEAMDLVNRSHLVLVLAQDQPAQIPAKIYE
jgi:glycosyltransferase involved in cell wall biosynthesis